MKVVILAGGFGTRISEESHLKPKPLVEIGEKPILWHIMKIYSHFGFNDFIICLGYDDLVTFFENRNIPLAINHCVSLYPTEDNDLELNQIDFLKNRYPHHTIGFSSHEYHDWQSSIMIAYAKGARTFERHIDVEEEGFVFSPYCSRSHQTDEWFKAFKKAKEMCGNTGTQKRIVAKKESEYLDTLVRGVYAKRDLPEGHILTHEKIDDDVYLAVPLQKGQISCRELMSGEVLLKPVLRDKPVMIDDIDSPYAYCDDLRETIYNRGL